MAGTFTKIYIHLVFSIKHRECLIQPSWEEELYGYIFNLIDNKKHKAFVVNGHRDHVHILFSLNPSLSLSDIVRDLKNNSSKFVNEKRFTNHKFQWQEGYGAFSYSESKINTVFHYIKNQKEHHRTMSFMEEYKEMLNKFNVEYEEKYLMDY